MALDSLDALEWHTQPSGPCTTQSPPFAFESQKREPAQTPGSANRTPLCRPSCCLDLAPLLL